MYCRNCGKENDDGVAFCSLCGKSPNEVAVTDKDPKAGFTVELIRNCFPWVFAAMFWLAVIGGMIGGANIGRNLAGYSDDKTTYMLVGGAIGLVVGFLIAVWSNGVVATLLKMDKNLQYLADKEKAKA